MDICPECVAGKHGNCDGVANIEWNPDTREDVYVKCECSHLELVIPDGVVVGPGITVQKEDPWSGVGAHTPPANDPGILTEAFPELVEDGDETMDMRLKADSTIIRDMYDVEVKNDRGEWVPAVPLPMTWPLGIKQCYCGKFRLGHKRYQEHYAYAHILGMDVI